MILVQKRFLISYPFILMAAHFVHLAVPSVMQYNVSVRNSKLDHVL